MKIVQEEPQKLKTDYEIVAPVKQEYKKSRKYKPQEGYDTIRI